MFNRLTLAASAVAVAAFVAGAAVPASAGHDRHERGAHHHHKHHGKHAPEHVVHTLHQMGFVTWDEIELDDGLWEVDDAVRADGSQWDIKLHPQTLEVVKRKLERKARVK